MRTQTIRDRVVRLLRQTPFRPFVLSMENGDRIAIEHPENIAFDPGTNGTEGSPDFYVLSGWGAVLGILMWSQGPWMQHMVPFFWPIQGAALVSWCFCWHWRRRSVKRGTAVASELCRQARAA